MGMSQEPQRPLPLEEMAATSPIAGVAEVVGLDVRRDPETGGIYTDARLRFLETWSASCPAELVLTQLGGELDGHRSAIAGWNWTLAPGETVVLFAKPWKGPYAVVTGRRLGLGHVDAQGRVTWDQERGSEAPRPSLEEVRTITGKALGRTLAAPKTSPVPASPSEAAKEGVAVPPAAPSPRAPRELENRGGLPFFLLAGVFVLAALALRLGRRRASGNRRA